MPYFQIKLFSMYLHTSDKHSLFHCSKSFFSVILWFYTSDCWTLPYANVVIANWSYFLYIIEQYHITFLHIGLAQPCTDKSNIKSWNTIRCLNKYIAPNSNMLDHQTPPQSPTKKRYSSSDIPKMVTPWNSPAVKQSIAKGCSNGCSLNWFIPSSSFQATPINGVNWKPVMVSLKKASNGLAKYMQKVWLGISFKIKNEIED